MTMIERMARAIGDSYMNPAGEMTDLNDAARAVLPAIVHELRMMALTNAPEAPLEWQAGVEAAVEHLERLLNAPS